LQHLSDNDLMSIRKMAHAMVNKFMHDPMVFLKRNGTQENQSVSVDIARKLFNLDDNDDT